MPVQCLEDTLGARHGAKQNVVLLPQHPDSVLAGREFQVHDIESAALEGDHLALLVVREAAEHLGTAIAGLMNLMNPAVVVLGGDLAGLGAHRDPVEDLALAVMQVDAADLEGSAHLVQRPR